ncbi:MAG: hypothetical protein H7201_04875 [Candidatus Saccharibacteria bacterium]|nr:hypothetical protein [Microbacteriaceae bacterium]
MHAVVWSRCHRRRDRSFVSQHRQAATLLGQTLRQLTAQRAARAGPKYHAIGLGRIRYNTADILHRRSIRYGLSDDS